ncbi:hypothetical protein FQA39_LY10965 [Lamprigera yunnana]|nr:hypothetical protein FQA39_LY10965 [Lamprigera yunnana]
MHSRGKRLVNLVLLEGNKQVDNNAKPTGSSEVQMNDDFNDFGSDDSVADKDYVPSATSSSESELDVGGKSDSESDILNVENSDTKVENTQDQFYETLLNIPIDFALLLGAGIFYNLIIADQIR